MGRSKVPGLRKRGRIWHIDKQIRGYGSLCESTGSQDLEEAQRYLAKRCEEIRQASVYGIRPTRTFREAATKYLLEHQSKASIEMDALFYRQLDPYIGDLPLDQVHDGTLSRFIESRLAAGKKPKTVNLALSTLRRTLNLAARKWRDEHGLSWLQTAPLISMLPLTDQRQPYPLSWEEQRLLFQALPAHLQRMALFKVNTGTRDQEVCRLRWDWEIHIPELDISLFLIPGRELYQRLFREQSVDQYLAQIVQQVRNGDLDHMLIYRKNLRKDAEQYTTTTSPHVVAARKSTQATGRLIRYVITTAGPEPIGNVQHPLDREHYVEKQVKPVAEPVLAALGLDFDSVIGDNRQLDMYSLLG